MKLTFRGMISPRQWSTHRLLLPWRRRAPVCDAWSVMCLAYLVYLEGLLFLPINEISIINLLNKGDLFQFSHLGPPSPLWLCVLAGQKEGLSQGLNRWHGMDHFIFNGGLLRRRSSRFRLSKTDFITNYLDHLLGLSYHIIFIDG